MPVRRPFVPFVIAALAALAPVRPLHAGQDGLTLEKAVETALDKNPEVLTALARVDAARGRTLQLRARPAPEAAASVEGLPLPGLKRAGDEIEVHLGIQQVFEYPGKRALRTEIGRLGEDTAEAELDRVRLLLGARVKRAYWAAAFADAAVDALERSSARLEALIDDLQARYRTGAASYADLLRARAERARLKNQVLEQFRDRRLARISLSATMGMDEAELPALATPLGFTPLVVDAAGLVEKARAGLPSFRIAALRGARADSAVKLAGLGRRPDFLAGFLLPSVRPNGWGVSFGLTMPFLRPGRAEGERTEAAAEAESARFEAAALDRRARSAVESAYAAARSAEEQVRVYEESLLRELEEELKIELEYFRYGKTEALGLLDLHRTLVLAQVEHLRALLLYNLALADLEVAGESAD